MRLEKNIEPCMCTTKKILFNLEKKASNKMNWQ